MCGSDCGGGNGGDCGGGNGSDCGGGNGGGDRSNGSGCGQAAAVTAVTVEAAAVSATVTSDVA